mgnify:CR=1 FL=1
MEKKQIDFKSLFKSLPLSIFSIVIAFFFTFTLIYFNFYIHELGHANSALLHTVITHNTSTTINFTYQDYMLFGKNLGLKYPKQTLAVMPNLMSIYGVLFSIIFYAFIFLLLAKIKLIKNNNYLGIPLAITFLALILQDIVSNLFCGTDGLDLACSQFTFGIISWVFWITILLSLGFFFNLLFMTLFNKIKRGKQNG